MRIYLANKVAELRKKKGLTQVQLASRLGVSRQTIIAMEKGDYCPAIILAIDVARVFGRRVEEVFTVKKATQT